MKNGIKVKLEPSPEMLKALDNVHTSSQQLKDEVHAFRMDLRAGGILVGVVLVLYFLFGSKRA